MTTTLIDRTKLDAVGRRLKNQIIVIAVVAVVIVAICICLCLAATPQNYVWIIVANSAVSICGGWFVIYKLFADMFVLTEYKKLFARLLTMSQTKVVGVVESAQKNVTVRKNIVADVLTLVGDSRKYYFVGDYCLSEGTSVVLYVVDGFVCKVEVKNEQ